jgi:hypothetical protein
MNGDHVVDAADFIVWRKTVGTTILAADGDFDGDVDGDYYNVWHTHFGDTPGSGSSNHAIPEPLSLALLMLTGAATAISRIGRGMMRPQR